VRRLDLSWIHRNRGAELTLDAETASLLDFATQCFEISGGLFDITSGVLRRAGLLSTLALLQGERAEAFLTEQGVRHWVGR
jgi:hypothetical protein